MVGIETFAIEVSRTCMNVPSAKATAVRALVLPASAGAGATMEESALTVSRPCPARVPLLARRHEGGCALGASFAAEPGGLVGFRTGVIGDDGRDARVHRGIVGRTRLPG